MGELVRVVLEKLVRCGVLFKGKESDVLFTPDTFPTKYISEILKYGSLFTIIYFIRPTLSHSIGQLKFKNTC